ncbi:solute carrier family 7 member 14 [Saccoglossus kowalevskii]|uniref:Probable cationic amino acid transporter n=1 Tax=Saccoglossus kowalevskii TaxID=10224 RepID=A0ABM0GIS6_SACKO|nr:PREDICTED: probable cationic amino acid transporter [Saccoglossus kowalevskii]
MGFSWSELLERLLRKKAIDSSAEIANVPISGSLSKCLSTMDLVSLGVGSCIGTGMYVVSGLVARNVAGPAVILSFMIAAFASILSGVCYAEFGVRVPKTTGSAYMYSYVTVGEFCAFIIGWNLILEYLIGTAAGASALSSCFDSLVHHKISHFMLDNVGQFGIHTKSYPDLLACVIVIVMTLVITAGVKKSVGFNNALNALNVAVWVFIMVAGLFYVKSENWTDGFMPYGFSGVITGAATCFYAFIGFDIIATTGEEARQPSKSIPIAIVLSLLICLTAYVSVSIILTLMVPYYDISPESPLLEMFVQNDAYSAKYVVAIGAICGLTVSLLGSLFPMPRVMYAMSSDGLLFRFMSRINDVTKTPAIATIISGFIAAIMALLIGLQDLIEMMSIGTLLAYTIVSMCVLILRYQPHVDSGFALQTTSEYDIVEEEEEDALARQKKEAQAAMYAGEESVLKEAGPEKLIPKTDSEQDEAPKMRYGAVEPEPDNFKTYNEANFTLSRLREGAYKSYHQGRNLIGLPDKSQLPTAHSGKLVTYLTLFLFAVIFVFSSLVIYGRSYLQSGNAWLIILVIIFLGLIFFCILKIYQQPQNPERLKFMAPCVPFLPIVAMFINIYLMLKLSYLTWIRFAIWLIVGFVIYFGYGIWNSNLATRCSDISRVTKDGKDTLILDNTMPQMTTESSVIPAHADTEKVPLEPEQEGYQNQQTAEP